MRQLISNSQQVCRDCFAPAPKIDLTLRTNGEQAVSVIDALGNVIIAGFEAPTIAPTVAAGSTGGVNWLTGSIFATGTTVYWQYRYVYVAKTRYPLVENAVTGGGSPAPRSNPSPVVATALDNSTNATKTRIITVSTTQREDISHIWIYRTNVWDTAVRANDAAEGGLMFWIGEVANNPNYPITTFEDLGPDTDESFAQEQIELDNYIALEAKYCTFDGTFFWTIGNDARTIEVTLDSTGGVINLSSSPWFNGRNGQIATFDGITSGGFDNKGSFYIKFTSTFEAQLYANQTLTTTIGSSITGTTQMTVRGLATTLFRSKIRNPFSWGYTDQIGTIQVPTPYNFSIGGGRATALTVVPNVNLLKIDVENPPQTFTLNLKNAGTPNFEPSLRPIATSYTASINSTQFAATVGKGLNELWAMDTKTFAIVQCDGTSQLPVSDYVCQTLRKLATEGDDLKLFHGCYHSRLELNLMFFRTEGAREDSINRAIYHHWPTGFWGLIDAFDVSASCTMVNPFINESVVVVGNSLGWIGIFGAKDKWSNWCPNGSSGKFTEHAEYPGEMLALFFNDPEHVSEPLPDLTLPGIVGNWIMVWDEDTDNNKLVNFRLARVETCEVVFVLQDPDDPFGPTESAYRILTDGNWYNRDFEIINLGTYTFNFPYANGPTYFSIGPIEMQLGRFFNAGVPFISKKLEEVHYTFSYPTINVGQITILPNSITFGSNFDWSYVAERNGDYPPVETPLLLKQYETPLRGTKPIGFGIQTDLAIDQSAVFGIMVSDRNQFETVIMNYQVNVSAT